MHVIISGIVSIKIKERHMGLISRIGKRILLSLSDLKLLGLAREKMPYVSVKADGLVFFFKNTDHSIIDAMVVDKQVWSRDEMDYVLGYCKSVSILPQTVIDIGANVGTSIIYFRDRIGEESHCYALEPVRENYDLLVANCAVNGFHDINTYNLGISDVQRECRLEINPGNMATCRIAGTDDDGLVFRKDDESYVGETASFTTIDEFVSENNIKQDSTVLLWIDVEGHEPEVFKSGMDTFRNYDTMLFMEYNPKLYKHNGTYDSFISSIKECFGAFICYEKADHQKYAFRDIDEIDKVADETGLEQCNLFLVKRALRIQEQAGSNHIL